MPEKEWPTRTVGPSCRASTRSAEATASGNVVRGFCTAVALSPAFCNRAITSDQDDPSANSPCTSTMLRAFGATGSAGASWTKVLAAPAATMLTKARRFIRYPCGKSSLLFMEVLLFVKLEFGTWKVGVGYRASLSRLDRPRCRGGVPTSSLPVIAIKVAKENAVAVWLISFTFLLGRSVFSSAIQARRLLL